MEQPRANLYCYKKENWEWDYSTFPDFLSDKRGDRMVVNMTTMNLLRLLMRSHEDMQRTLEEKHTIKKNLWINDMT